MRNYLPEIDEILEHEPDPAFARRARIILKNLNLSDREKILEVGCGRGFYLKILIDTLPHLDITGIDLNEKYLSVAKGFINNNKVKLVKVDATNLPFKNKTFDRIIATEILEHIPNDQKAISEMYRVLKPDGIAMVTVPNKNYPFLWDPLNWLAERIFNRHIPSNIWWLSGIWADHVRLYDERDLKDKVEKEGFKIEKMWWATRFCLPFSHFLFYGIGKNLVERGCFKSLNRFGNSKKTPFLGRFLLWPIKTVDSRNQTEKNDQNSVNLIFKIRKI